MIFYEIRHLVHGQVIATGFLSYREAREYMEARGYLYDQGYTIEEQK